MRRPRSAWISQIDSGSMQRVPLTTELEAMWCSLCSSDPKGPFVPANRHALKAAKERADTIHGTVHGTAQGRGTVRTLSGVRMISGAVQGSVPRWLLTPLTKVSYFCGGGRGEQ